MKRAQLGMIGAGFVLVLGVSAGASWGENIDVDYVVNEAGCVTKITIAEKEVTVDKKAKKIKWKLDGPTLTKGVWKLKGVSEPWCLDEYTQDHSQNDKLVCDAKEAMKYEYELLWTDPVCDGTDGPVKADPVIIFKDGSPPPSQTPFWLWPLTALSWLVTAYFGIRFYRTRASAG